MRTRTAAVLLTIFLLVSCSSTPRTTVVTPAARVYHGTASVGDFMTITIDSSAQTISYTDVSNSTSGTVPYTVNSNGMYTLNDPKGNLTSAYEVPNYAMVIQAAKTGPGANTLALITAVESGQISLATFEGQSYNYMQFRTASGGVDIGSVNINAQGTGTTSSYWPYGALNSDNNSAFNSNALDMAAAVLDPVSHHSGPEQQQYFQLRVRHGERYIRGGYSKRSHPGLEESSQRELQCLICGNL